MCHLSIQNLEQSALNLRKFIKIVCRLKSKFQEQIFLLNNKIKHLSCFVFAFYFLFDKTPKYSDHTPTHRPFDIDKRSKCDILK